MEGEFTNYCKQYYDLLRQFDEQDGRIYNLVINALPYKKQTLVAELDAIIRYNRKVQKQHAIIVEIIQAKKEIEGIILKILDYFEIPKETVLTCQIPGQMELELWADEENLLHCIKTKDLEPLTENESIITIAYGEKRYIGEDEDD